MFHVKQARDAHVHAHTYAHIRAHVWKALTYTTYTYTTFYYASVTVKVTYETPSQVHYLKMFFLGLDITWIWP